MENRCASVKLYIGIKERSQIVAEDGRRDERGTALHETKPPMTLLARPRGSPHDPRIIADHQTCVCQGRLVSLTERAKDLDVAVAMEDTPYGQRFSGSH